MASDKVSRKSRLLGIGMGAAFVAGSLVGLFVGVIVDGGAC